MAGERTEGQSNPLKSRADALRGLASSGVLVQARAAVRDLGRAGAAPLTPVSAERMGQISPNATVRAQATEQPANAARAQTLSKPETQVELPTAGYGQVGEKTQQKEVSSLADGKEANQARSTTTSVETALGARKEQMQQLAQQLREQKVQGQDLGAGATGPTQTSRPNQDRGQERTR
jgi:hypothetical protein